jgi:hypothetical protein
VNNLTSFYNLALMIPDCFAKVFVQANTAITAVAAVLGAIMHLPDLAQLVMNSVVKRSQSFSPLEILLEAAEVSDHINVGKCEDVTLLGEVKMIRYALFGVL